MNHTPGEKLALHTLERQVKGNAPLRAFLEECRKLPECRRLALDSFITRPRTRFGRYSLVHDKKWPKFVVTENNNC